MKILRIWLTIFKNLNPGNLKRVYVSKPKVGCDVRDLLISKVTYNCDERLSNSFEFDVLVFSIFDHVNLNGESYHTAILFLMKFFGPFFKPVETFFVISNILLFFQAHWNYAIPNSFFAKLWELHKKSSGSSSVNVRLYLIVRLG